MNIYKQFRKFKKNAKALSPVIATIILIAVTVAVSVVVAAWMGGLTLGFMGNTEQAQITSTSYVSSTAVTVSVQNSGSATVTI
ncbi:MAG TPA: archaellin/type IV pilin N-terminal domain-containing protein, partial [Verrucomicrobiae bacterium]|nr:archaellin/type IV pilin N-terminal domain-containing protein [Verrucomicrobiae bacterium]